MTSPGAAEVVEKMPGTSTNDSSPKQRVAARIALRVPFYPLGRHVGDITAPTLVQLANTTM